MSPRPRLAVVLAGGLTACLLAPAAAPALTLKPCKGQSRFGCGTMVVPLDHSGATPGTLKLKVAVENTPAARRKPGVLVALSGGPGQNGVAFADDFAISLAPALKKYRLAVIDQRGTGGSGVIRCSKLQDLGDLQQETPEAIAVCALKVGAKAPYYSTRDTVEDLDQLRRELRAPKLALMGVSYGTFVAQQYARAHPATTDRLILDSVVGPNGVDPFLLDSYAQTKRVLTEQCAHGACAVATRDPFADLTVLAHRIVKHAIRGVTFNSAGHAQATSYTTGDQIANTLVAGDLNPYLQAALPGAIAAARNGDPAELLRLRRFANGAPAPATDLSAGLNVITGCEDSALPYALTSSLDSRPLAANAALAAINPATYAPFDALSVYRTSYAYDCLDFPPLTTTAPSVAPLPAVPTLLLSGRLDLRTPLQNGELVAAGVPGAQRVTVPGTGHDELDSDQTGCAEAALTRFIAGKKVGNPCKGKTNEVAPFPRPPRHLSDFRAAPGVAGSRGRVVFAALDTIADVRVSALQSLYAGFRKLAGGGLHGGAYKITHGTLVTLDNYAYLPGLRISGHVRLRGSNLRGHIRVTGPAGPNGTLTLRGTGALGRIGGRNVRYDVGGAKASAASARTRALPLLAQIAARLPAPSSAAVLRPRF